jgi:hypothetical protein
LRCVNLRPLIAGQCHVLLGFHMAPVTAPPFCQPQLAGLISAAHLSVDCC